LRRTSCFIVALFPSQGLQTALQLKQNILSKFAPLISFVIPKKKNTIHCIDINLSSNLIIKQYSAVK